jgi:hypothetical protein
MEWMESGNKASLDGQNLHAGAGADWTSAGIRGCFDAEVYPVTWVPALPDWALDFSRFEVIVDSISRAEWILTSFISVSPVFYKNNIRLKQAQPG